MNTKTILTRGRLAVVLIIAILLIDQAIKVWVKTHMAIGETTDVLGRWLQLTFIENDGMAGGMKLGSKLVLSLLRVVAIGFLSYYIWQQAKKHARWGYIVCLALILAGAAGNLIDCMFYGLCFDASTYDHVSQYVGFGNGYGSFLRGKVVDMFKMPFTFVYNFADAAITFGFIALFLFYRKELGAISGIKKENAAEQNKTTEGDT